MEQRTILKHVPVHVCECVRRDKWQVRTVNEAVRCEGLFLLVIKRNACRICHPGPYKVQVISTNVSLSIQNPGISFGRVDD